MVRYRLLAGGIVGIRYDYKVNNKIKALEVRVIAVDGINLGVMKTYDALRLAQEKESDLVLIAEGASPPVAKILDFNKYLYEERKKTSASKAKSKKSEVKEFIIRPAIGEGDLTTRINRAKGFISDGDRVKVAVKMMGRENDHSELAYAKIDRFAKELGDCARFEQPAKRVGNMITATFIATKC